MAGLRLFPNEKAYPGLKPWAPNRLPQSRKVPLSLWVKIPCYGKISGQRAAEDHPTLFGTMHILCDKDAALEPHNLKKGYQGCTGDLF